jgi:hypothetical protein
MPRIEPGLVPVVTDLERGLRELSVPFAVVGALVPELLLDVSPGADDQRCGRNHRCSEPCRFRDAQEPTCGLWLHSHAITASDAAPLWGPRRPPPFSESIAPGGRLQLEEGFVFNMAGFGQVVPNALQTVLDGGPTLPLAPLPLYALLKLVAFSDRKQSKDLTGVFHCLQHYLEADERRYGVDHQGEGVPYEYTCAYLLGAEGRRFLDKPLRDAVTSVLDRFSDPDADVIGIIAREKGRVWIEDDERAQIFEHFRWYRLGTDL